jgi:ATP synthase F1 gamma subunit
MIPIAKLKQNLETNKTLGDIIEVMKMVAALQFNQFRAQHGPLKEFLLSLENALSPLLNFPEKEILLESRPNLPAEIILISSDEGFLGGLNLFLINRCLEIRREQDKTIVLGQQGARYFEELKIDFLALPAVSDKLEFSQVEKVRDEVLNRYIKGQTGQVRIIYPLFVNITFQQVQAQTLLPLANLPVSGRKTVGEYLIEPDFKAVLYGWLKLWLGLRLYEIFWTSKMAEFAARIMHLEGSIQELMRVNQRLKLEYFKYLHGISDKTIREIYASRLMRKYENH